MPLNPLVARALRESDGSAGGAPMGGDAGSKPDWYKNLVESLGQGVPMAGGSSSPGAAGAAVGGDQVSRIMAALRQIESGGNYSVYSKLGGSASGAYQFIRDTWNNYGGYRNAADAPAQIQDQRAREDVTKFLRMYGGRLEAVPIAWFTGSYTPGKNYDYHPGGPAGNPRVSEYLREFMEAYNSLG